MHFTEFLSPILDQPTSNNTKYGTLSPNMVITNMSSHTANNFTVNGS